MELKKAQKMEGLDTIKPGDIVIYRISLLQKKHGKVQALSRNGETCVVSGKLVHMKDICKIVPKV